MAENNQTRVRKNEYLCGGTFTWKVLRCSGEEGEPKRDSSSSKCHLVFQHGEGFRV